MIENPKKTLQEMCAQYDVTPRALRYYEYIELLAPEKVGRKRFYGAREHARLTMILRARRLGFALEDVRKWLNLYDGKHDNPNQLQMLDESATAQIAKLTTQISDLQNAVAELHELRAWARSRKGAPISDMPDVT